MSRIEAMQKMAESLDSLVNLKIKVPLSSKTKNIHTNCWIYYKPLNFGDKIEKIYGEMSGFCKQFRYTFYRKNYWYVKNVNVRYSDGTMELTLSPMPTPFGEEKLNNGSSNSTSKTSKSATNKTTVSKKNVDYYVDKIAKQMKNEKHTYHGGRYDCFSMSHKLTCYLRKHGVTAKTIVYYSATSNSGTHRTVRYKNDKGEWVDFPYGKYGFDSLFGVTSYAKNGKEYKESC